MYLESGTLVYSPSDITIFMASPFASWMERLVLEYPDHSPEPDPADELGSVLQQRGLQHEAHQLQQFREQGFTIADLSEQALSSNSFPLRQQATLEAMRAGYLPFFHRTSSSPVRKATGRECIRNNHFPKRGQSCRNNHTMSTNHQLKADDLK